MEIQKIALTGLMSGQLYLETMTELKDYDICNRELNQRIANTTKLMERTIAKDIHHLFNTNEELCQRYLGALQKICTTLALQEPSDVILFADQIEHYFLSELDSVQN